MISIEIKGVAQLNQKFIRLEKEIPRAGKRGIYQVLKEGKQIAKSLAPRHTGNLKAGIRRSSVKKKGKIISGTLSSSVPKNFPYHFWVNENPGYRYVRLAKRRTNNGKWPTKALRSRLPNIYTKRMLYRQTRTTGQPGYFNKTIMILKQRYPQIMMNEIRNGIKKSGFK